MNGLRRKSKKEGLGKEMYENKSREKEELGGKSGKENQERKH